MAHGGGDGTFLLHPRPDAGKYVLSVVYRGKPTHHLLCREAPGRFVINKSAIDANDLDEVRWEGAQIHRLDRKCEERVP